MFKKLLICHNVFEYFLINKFCKLMEIIRIIPVKLTIDIFAFSQLLKCLWFLCVHEKNKNKKNRSHVHLKYNKLFYFSPFFYLANISFFVFLILSNNMHSHIFFFTFLHLPISTPPFPTLSLFIFSLIHHSFLILIPSTYTSNSSSSSSFLFSVKIYRFPDLFLSQSDH